MRATPIQTLMLLVALAALLSVSAQFACADDECLARRGAYFTSMEEIAQNRIQTLDEALARQGVTLSVEQQSALARDGHLSGAVRLDRPIKQPDGSVEMPAGWLPEIPAGHPWARPLTPADAAFYSWFEERIVDVRLYDPENPEHVAWATAYLAKARSRDNTFPGWTYATASCKSY